MIKTNYKGFTLLELLIVVIIVAVLAAVAWPQYKHAMLKSRFSKVMPVAKAIADAQEVHYLGNLYYVQEDEKDRLDVSFPDSGEDITISLSTIDGYDYVRAVHTKVPGVRYVRYQNYSGQFPGEIHCEAEDGNDDAQWVCKSIGGTNNDNPQVSSDGYIVYIVKGTGNGILPSENGGEEEENDDPNACHEGDTAPASMPQITAGGSGATGTATCVNGKWRYVWTGGDDWDRCSDEIGDGEYAEESYYCAGGNFSSESASCNASHSPYGCAGSTFSGGASLCEGNCMDSTFSGGGATCAGNCTGSTFSGASSWCMYNCANSTFSGIESICGNSGDTVCAGSVFKAGSSCVSRSEQTCAGAIYEGGCCSGYMCPSGSPRCGEWNDTTQSYDIDGTW